MWKNSSLGSIKLSSWTAGLGELPWNSLLPAYICGLGVSQKCFRWDVRKIYQAPEKIISKVGTFNSDSHSFNASLRPASGQKERDKRRSNLTGKSEFVTKLEYWLCEGNTNFFVCFWTEKLTVNWFNIQINKYITEKIQILGSKQENY